MDEIPRDFVEKIHDEFFDEAQKLFNGKPVCGDFEFGLCNARVHTIDAETVYQLEKEYEKGTRPGVCCCDRCRYLTRKGCTTKNLKCKLFLCYYQEKNQPELLKSLKAIQYRCNDLGFDLAYFVSREVNIESTLRNIRWHKTHMEKWLKLMAERTARGESVEAAKTT